MTRSKLPNLRPLLFASVLAATSLGACHPPERVEVTTSRREETFTDPVVPGASAEQRFGEGSMASAAPSSMSADGASDVPIEWDVPEGWVELAASDMRIANLRPAGHPDAECSVIILPGSAGGLTANLNRWAKQMGLPPLDDAEVDALPTTLLLGMPATVIDLEGAYSGMGDVAREGFALRGVVLPTDAFTVFVKMTGPADVVAAESDAFDTFCASIRGKSAGGHSADDGHDHGAPVDDDPHRADPHTEVTGAPATEAQIVTSGAWRYELQPGWTDVGPRSMRSVNLLAGAETQCYVVELPGEAGGELPNLNRWAGEVGAAALTQVDVAALPRVELLGAECPLLEVSGDYSGMGDGGGPGSTILGTLKIDPIRSIFVKMVGPSAEVAEHAARFRAFCESLEPTR